MTRIRTALKFAPALLLATPLFAAELQPKQLSGSPAEFALMAPANLPKDLANRLSAEVAKAVRSTLATERLGEQGFDAVGSRPEEFSTFLEQELVKYTRIVRQANIKVE